MKVGVLTTLFFSSTWASWKKGLRSKQEQKKQWQSSLTSTGCKNRPLKGYIWLATIVASAHALHSLHHACVRPGAPASALVPLVSHGYLEAGKDAAGQQRRHAGQSETGADSQEARLISIQKYSLTWVWKQRIWGRIVDCRLFIITICPQIKFMQEFWKDDIPAFALWAVCEVLLWSYRLKLNFQWSLSQ